MNLEGKEGVGSTPNSLYLKEHGGREEKEKERKKECLFLVFVSCVLLRWRGRPTERRLTPLIIYLQVFVIVQFTGVAVLLKLVRRPRRRSKFSGAF